jgi:hypothetical protein
MNRKRPARTLTVYVDGRKDGSARGVMLNWVCRGRAEYLDPAEDRLDLTYALSCPPQ